MIKIDRKQLQRRGGALAWHSFSWMVFIVLGWWLRGFFQIYYGEEKSFTEYLAMTVRETGGWGGFVGLIGAAVVVFINIKNVMRKRTGE